MLSEGIVNQILAQHTLVGLIWGTWIGGIKVLVLHLQLGFTSLVTPSPHASLPTPIFVGSYAMTGYVMLI